MKTFRKSAYSVNRPPLIFRIAAMLLLVAMPVTSVPVSVFAADESNSPSPVMDANGPAAVTTPQHIKARTGSRAGKPVDTKLKLSSAPTDGEIATARVMEEPLVPTQGKTSRKENAALAQALKDFQARQLAEDVSALTDFLSKYPDSRWKASLQVNIGLIQCQTGFFSRALASWALAWNLAKEETSPAAKAMADRAIGELLVLNARLGRVEVLQQYFPALEDRKLQGAAAEKISAAKEGLWRMEHHPEIAFRCGPFAVNSILNIGKKVKGRDPIIEAARSTEMGTSLAQVKGWADAVKLDYQMAKRTPGSAVIVPAVVHWSVGHFAAIVDQKNGRYLIQDPTFGGGEFWVSAEALDAEGSGYYLVPSGTLPAGWQAVTDPEEVDTVWGRGGANDRANNDTQKKNPDCGMAGASVVSALATLQVGDTPIWYRPPVGPQMNFSLYYNQLESNQPANFTFSNFGYGWAFDWLSYLTVDASRNVTVTLRGGGTEVYNFSLMDNVTNVYAPNILSQATILLVSSGVYERHLPDGSKEVFSQPDGTGRIFLTQVVDAQGNSALVHYDANFRIDYILDALNQKTTITYVSNTVGNAGFYKIARITDPFNRYAQFGYDSTVTQLLQITDVVGITSQFTYNNGTGTDTYITSGMDSLTTPYGTTRFYNYHPNGDTSLRGLLIIYPDGSKEVTENWMGHNLTTYHWNKRAMELFPGDQTKAQTTHWLLNPHSNVQSSVMDKTKDPLEVEVGYMYPGQSSAQDPDYPNDPTQRHNYTGAINQPRIVTRILGGGSYQIYYYEYNDFGKVTQSIDPQGRTLTYYYAANGIDLMEVRQNTNGSNDLLGKWYYNSQHRPVFYIDGSGQRTSYGYNARGQLASVTNAKGNTTTLTYDSNGYLTQIDGPLAGSSDVTTFAWDGFGRLRTATDSEGYSLTYDYDALNRLTKVTYPDGTYEQTTWDRLDPILARNRLGQWTQRSFNAVRQLVAETDPLGRTTNYAWCTCGALESLTDAAGHTTTWIRDVEGRPTQKIFADSSIETYTYENAISRLKTTTDAKGQVAHYSYNLDNSLAQVSYTDTQGQPLSPATSSVAFAYDPNYLRLATVQNSWGTLSYTYTPYVTDPWGASITGGGKLQRVSNNVLANSDITYAYDELGRSIGRSINAASNASSAVYDAMGRVTAVTNPLGTFGYNYVDPTLGTRRLSSVTYPNGQVTNYSYLNNTGDQRLQEIKNLDPQSNVLSQFDYAYNAVGNITQWTRQVGTGAPLRYDLGYDKASQLTSAVSTNTVTNAVVKQYFYGYDAAANRTSEQIDTSVSQATYNNVNALTTVSSGSGAVWFQGTLNEPGTVTVNGTAAAMTTATNFVANPVLNSGTNYVTINAQDGSGNSQSNIYKVVVDAGSGRSLGYDAVGSLTNNGNGQSYEWDAAKRLVAINYASGTVARTEFTYDGLGQRVGIVEKDGNGTVTSTKQFIWSPGDVQPSEERDASNTVTKRFYPQGEQIAGQSYYYTRDHLGSVRELTDATGAIAAQYDYDPYGRRTKVQGAMDADFGYTGHYEHATSALKLTLFRAYDAELGRWISRDPIAEAGGLNLYGYVKNNPVNYFDLEGLAGWKSVPGQSGWEYRHDPSAGGGDPNHTHYRNRGRDVARRVYPDGEQSEHGDGIDRDVPDDVINNTPPHPHEPRPSSCPTPTPGSASEGEGLSENDSNALIGIGIGLLIVGGAIAFAPSTGGLSLVFAF